MKAFPEAIRKPGVDTDGLIYHVPFDIGFSALTYRADKVNPAELSWNVLLDAPSTRAAWRCSPTRSRSSRSATSSTSENRSTRTS